MNKTLSALIRLLRPHQWIKNAFVFVGLIFSHAWNQPHLLIQVIFAAIAFCLMSSAVYIYNDIIDYPHDQLHPTKKHRPIASQTISKAYAIVVGTILFCFSLLLGWKSSAIVTTILIAYLLLNVAYTHIIKHMVILDVFAISAGFMLRILAGTLGVSILPSQWLMFCGLMITLFLGFTKRRAEMLSLQQHHFTRQVLKNYSAIFLDKMIGITASCSIIGYGLYTMSPETIRTHHTTNLIYTIPFVIYGIFRYLYLLHSNSASGEDTAKDMLLDRHLLLTVVAWFLVVLSLIK